MALVLGPGVFRVVREAPVGMTERGVSEWVATWVLNLGFHSWGGTLLTSRLLWCRSIRL